MRMRQWIHANGTIRDVMRRPGRRWEPLADRVPDGFEEDSVMLHAMRDAEGYSIYIEIAWNDAKGGWERTETPPMTQEDVEHYLLTISDEPPDTVTSVTVGDDGVIAKQEEL